MADEAELLVSELIAGVAHDLDVPPALEATLHQLYDDVSRWMGEALDAGDWSIRTQGSARLGTMVRHHRARDYDIDAVVVRHLAKEGITQQELKTMVGAALDSYIEARLTAPEPKFTSVSEDRRCFTLGSNAPLHMDLLPTVPDSDSPTALWIPDRELRRWQPSDPIGFANWFFNQMATQVIEEKAAIAKRAQVDVEDVPDWQVRTMLQRTVQVLKAHRNCYFQPGDPDHASSIVITATAARAYRGETSLVDAVMSVATRMPEYIAKEGSTYVVVNPSHPEENFADLWTQARAVRFFAWLDDLQRLLDEALRCRLGMHRVASTLGSGFGRDPVTKAVERLGLDRTAARDQGRLAVAGSGLLGTAGLAVKPHTFHGA